MQSVAFLPTIDCLLRPNRQFISIWIDEVKSATTRKGENGLCDIATQLADVLLRVFEFLVIEHDQNSWSVRRVDSKLNPPSMPAPVKLI
jgi:hypothetical protein